MEEKLKILQNLIPNVRFWLNSDGDVIHSDLCTMYPRQLRIIANLDLVADVFMFNEFDNLRLRFFNANS